MAWRLAGAKPLSKLMQMYGKQDLLGHVFIQEYTLDIILCENGYYHIDIAVSITSQSRVGERGELLEIGVDALGVPCWLLFPLGPICSLIKWSRLLA